MKQDIMTRNHNSMYTDIPSYTHITTIRSSDSSANKSSNNNSNNKRAYIPSTPSSSSTTALQAAAIASTNNSIIKDYFPANKLLKSGGSELSIPNSNEGEGKGVVVYDLTSDTSDDEEQGGTDNVYDKENSVNSILNNMPTTAPSSSSSTLYMPYTHTHTDRNSSSTPCHQSYHSSSSYTLHSNTSYTSSTSAYPTSYTADAYPAQISTYTPYTYTPYNNPQASNVNHTTYNTVPIVNTYLSSYNTTDHNNNTTSITNTPTTIQTHIPIVPTTLTTVPTPPMIPTPYNHTSLDYPCNFLYQPLCTCLTTAITSTTTSTTPTATPTAHTADKKPTKLSRVRKTGQNQGRLFWSCAETRKPTKCNYFLWADKLFPICKCNIQPNTTSNITTNHHNNNNNNTTTTNNSNICIIRRVLKPGPTNGCYFFTCSNSKGCGYFIWAHVYNQTCAPLAGIQLLLSQYDIPL